MTEQVGGSSDCSKLQDFAGRTTAFAEVVSQESTGAPSANNGGHSFAGQNLTTDVVDHAAAHVRQPPHEASEKVYTSKTIAPAVGSAKDQAQVVQHIYSDAHTPTAEVVRRAMVLFRT